MSDIVKRQVELEVTMNDDVKFPITVEVEIDLDAIVKAASKTALLYVRGKAKTRSIRCSDKGPVAVIATISPESKQVRDVMVRLHGKGSRGAQPGYGRKAGDQSYSAVLKSSIPK